MSRDARQKSLIPPERLAKTHALVVGVGAVGRQVALLLGATGVPSITLVDPDTVQDVNLGPQMYPEYAVDRDKVDVTAGTIYDLNPHTSVVEYKERFLRRRAKEYLRCADGFETSVFCCVDSISARRRVWESVRDHCYFFVDGRVGGETVRVITGGVHYEDTLFDESEAFVGSCTAKMTGYLAAVTAGLMLAQWSKHLRQLPLDPDLTLDVLGTDLILPEKSHAPT